MKIIIKTLSKEKNDMEDLILKQESKVSDLAAKIKIVEKNIKDKNKEIAENEENTMKLINILEEQKKQLENLQKNQANLASNKIVLSTRDEMHLKKIISEKENEITTLKVYNDNLKNDLHVKDQNIAAMQKTLSKYQEEIKRLKMAKINELKEKNNGEGNKDKENEIKNNVVNPKLWTKKTRIEAKDINLKDDQNDFENAIKNKLNSKKILQEKSNENYTNDFRLPDINKNHKNKGVLKKHSNPKDLDRYESDGLKTNFKEKDNVLKAINSTQLRKQSSHKKVNMEENKNDNLLNDELIQDKFINEKKITSSKKGKENQKDQIEVDLENTSHFQQLEAENDNNINDISNMMKKILSDENQII